MALGREGDSDYCMGAIVTIAMYEQGRSFCWKNETSFEDLADQYIAYVETHPEARMNNYVDATIKALGEAYPCD